MIGIFHLHVVFLTQLKNVECALCMKWYSLHCGLYFTFQCFLLALPDGRKPMLMITQTRKIYIWELEMPKQSWVCLSVWIYWILILFSFWILFNWSLGISSLACSSKISKWKFRFATIRWWVNGWSKTICLIPSTKRFTI